MRRALALVAAVLGASCTSPRTQVMVVIDADSGLRASASAITATVFGGPSEDALQPASEETLRSPARWPLSMAIVPRGNDASRAFRVVVTAEDASGNTLVVARAISGFVKDETRTLRIDLESACIGHPCGAETTCRAGACVDAHIDPAALLPYPPPDGGGQPSGDGGPLCGNQRMDPLEACDDGVENGAYGRCATNCGGPGPRCGDGTVQPEHEECDEPLERCTDRCEYVAPQCGDGNSVPGEFCLSGAPTTMINDLAGNTHGVAIGEFDGDGHADIAYASTDASIRTHVLYGDGRGGFLDPGVRPPIASRVVTTDFDSDGRTELVMLNYDGVSQVGVILPDRSGLTTLATPSYGGRGVALAVADVAGSEAPDIVVATDVDNVRWFENSGGGFQGHTGAIDMRALEMVVAPRRDGEDARIIVYHGGGQLIAYRVRGGSLERESAVPVLQANTVSLAGGDLDGDGRFDVVVTEDSGFVGARIRVFELGPTGLSEHPTVGQPAGWFWHSSLIDVDRDGDVDYLGNGDSGFFWGRNDGGALELTQYDPTLPACRAWEAEPGDLNGDGAIDLAISSMCGLHVRLARP